MRSSRHNRSMFRDTFSLAGWLFADLLLGLAMLFFVFNTVGVESPAPTQPTSTPAPTPTPYPTYTPVPTPQVVTLNPTPREYTFNMGDPALDQRLRDQFAQLQGARAGMVLTFGCSSNAGSATVLSRDFNNRIKNLLPDIFRDAVTKDYIDLEPQPQTCPSGHVRVEIYLLSG